MNHHLGGTALTKHNAQNNLHGLSQTPNCFFLRKKDKHLAKGTRTLEKRSQNQAVGNEPTELESSDVLQNPNGRALGKKWSTAAIHCRKFGFEFKFSKLGYIVNSLYSGTVFDPASYQLHPGNNFSAFYVNDKRPILMEQCQTSGESKVSAIVALWSSRAEKPPQIRNTEN